MFCSECQRYTRDYKKSWGALAQVARKNFRTSEAQIREISKAKRRMEETVKSYVDHQKTHRTTKVA